MASQKVSGSSEFVSFKYAKGQVDIYNSIFHDHYEMYLLLNGDVEFVNNRNRQKITPYQMVIIPAGEYHQFIVNQDIDNYERCVLDIYPGLLGKDFLSQALCGKEVLTLPENHRIIENILHLKRSLYTYNNSEFSQILSAIAIDTIFLIKYTETVAQNPVYKLHPVSMEIMKYINENYQKNISLTDISDRFFISVSSVCHIFKETYGVTIKKYMIEKRMNGARLSLQNGKKPQEVSEEFGFSNYSTFYRAYIKHFSCSPAETVRPKAK